MFDETLDQGLAVYGGPVCDDCISDSLAHAPPGSKILLVIDVCHADALAAIEAFPDPGDDLATSCKGCEAREIQASTLVFAACGADESAKDIDTNGAFTAAIVDAWSQGRFDGDYDALYKHVLDNIDNPTPILRFYRDREDASFRRSLAFRPVGAE